MSTIASAIRDLEARLQKIDSALNSLRGIEGESRRGPGRPRGGGKISAAGLQRIREAQKKRWAKYHAAQRKTSKAA